MYDPAYIIALFEALSADAQQEILDLAARLAADSKRNDQQSSSHCPLRSSRAELKEQPSSFRAMAALHLSPLQQYSCFFDETLLFCFWRCTNGRRLALPGREVMSMVTYGELFAYTLVLIGVATLVFQMCKRK